MRDLVAKEYLSDKIEPELFTKIQNIKNASKFLI